MVKAKVLKQLRKKIEKADRIIDSSIATILVPSSSAPDGVDDGHGKKQRGGIRFERKVLSKSSEIDNTDTTNIADNVDAAAAKGNQREERFLSLEYCSSGVDLNDALLKECLDLFEVNMGDMYKSSSWGLDLKAKAEELQHKKARFLFVYNDSDDGTTTSTSQSRGKDENKCNHDDDDHDNTNKTNKEGMKNNKKELASFVHFRFCYDDDDEPEYAVLYVYEIHVKDTYQRCGIGKQIMSLLEQMAAIVGLEKVMLTVFKANQHATQFYTKHLDYQIDTSSPSRHGEKNVDYEILSKTITSSR